MRHWAPVLLLLSAGLPVFSQTADSGDALLSKARGLYDAPFTRQLVSFDCSVQFDWTRHFINTLGAVPPATIPTVKQLQSISHRVFVDRSGATVSEVPTATDLSGIAHAADLETTFQAVVSAGLDAWLPFAANEILPSKPTTFRFQPVSTGFTVMMEGSHVSATLNLLPDMRISTGVSDLPQPQHFATDFIPGPQGYLLQSLRTGAGATDQNSGNASFAFHYGNVHSFQLPVQVVVTQLATGEKWDYSLDDCKAMSGITLNVHAPKQ